MKKGPLSGTDEEEPLNRIRKHERTGRPLGGDYFVAQLASTLDRQFMRGKPGPKGNFINHLGENAECQACIVAYLKSDEANS